MTLDSAQLRGLDSELRRIRHDLHRHPEIGLDLPRTQQRVLEALEGLPLEITLGSDCSAVTAVLRGRSREHSVLLRGDMDALPVQERTGLGFASEIDGAMHACGHDLHTAMLIGAARILSAEKETLPGDVVFMFQPGEEGLDGASHMVRDGVLDATGARVQAGFALHVMSSGIPLGMFATREGAMMASADALQVTVIGRGGHGSAPHLANDPVTAAAEMVTQTQIALARNMNALDPAVVSVGVLEAGTQRNIIPEQAHFEATVRCFSADARERVREVLTTAYRGIAAAHGCEVEVEFISEYPPTVNTPGMADAALAVAAETLGEDRVMVLEHPYTASEDFSRVLDEVPGAFIALGACPEGSDFETAPFNHSAFATFDDGVLLDGARVLAALARNELSLPNPTTKESADD